jgi:hypothetical protein
LPREGTENFSPKREMGLACLVHGVDVIQVKHLGSLLGLSSNLSDGRQGWVEVAGTEEVTGIEGINSAISLEVIDIKGKLNCLNFRLLQTK